MALLGGPLGILLSVALAITAGAALGWSPVQAAVIGIVISVASTMVLARLLIDRGELHSSHGRVMIGITLVEDLAVVVLTVVLGAMGPSSLGACSRSAKRCSSPWPSWSRSPTWPRRSSPG